MYYDNISTKLLQYDTEEIFLVKASNNHGNNVYLLYAPTLGRVFHISKDLATLLKNMNSLDDTANKGDIGFICSTLKGMLPYRIKPLRFNSTPTIFPLSIGLTTACTLRCLYCHADAGADRTMSDEILDAALWHAFETSKNTPTIEGIGMSFSVGGEPTFHWERFKSFIEKINKFSNEYNVKVYKTMTTNGYYSLNKCEYIAQNFDSVLLSIDGKKEVQDLLRPTALGQGSFEVVLHAAKYFSQNIDDFAMRGTVTNYNVTEMEDFVQFLVNNVGNKHAILFESVVPLGRASSNNNLTAPPADETFFYHFLKARNLGKKLGVEVKTSVLENLNRLGESYCGAMNIFSFTVNPEGLVTTCGRDVDGVLYNYGYYCSNEKKFFFDEDAKKKIKEKAALPKKCSSCFCKWHCSGDCVDTRRLVNRCKLVQNFVFHDLLELTK